MILLNSKPDFGRLVAATWCVAACVLSGCGGGSERSSGIVSGHVTFQGEPVTSGVVNLISSSRGLGASAHLGEDGKYKITEPVETGEYKVVISLAPQPPPRIEDGPPKPPKPAANIPEKYRSESTTDLTTIVDEGDNALDFDLKP